MNNQKLFVTLSVLFSFVSSTLSAQKINLSPELNEISGLTWWRNNLVAINDGGNQPLLYFLNEKGAIVHRCLITNAVNRDWESITNDSDGNLYIADCGNNLNNQKEITIYKVAVEMAFSAEQINAETCTATLPYPELPLPKNNLDFDFEAMNWEGDQLVFYSKSRAKPWHGKTVVYQLEWKPGKSELLPVSEIFVGKGGWMIDAVTGSCSTDSTTVLLTYKKLLEIEKGRMRTLKRFIGWRQREGIAVNEHRIFYVVSERSLINRYPKLETVHLK